MPRPKPTEVTFENSDWEGGTYFVSPDARWFACDVGDHQEFAKHYFGTTIPGMLDAGWIRVVAGASEYEDGERTLYWQGKQATPRQFRLLKDAAAFGRMPLRRDRVTESLGQWLLRA